MNIINSPDVSFVVGFWHFENIFWLLLSHRDWHIVHTKTEALQFTLIKLDKLKSGCGRTVSGFGWNPFQISPRRNKRRSQHGKGVQEQGEQHVQVRPLAIKNENTTCFIFPLPGAPASTPIGRRFSIFLVVVTIRFEFISPEWKRIFRSHVWRLKNKMQRTHLSQWPCNLVWRVLSCGRERSASPRPNLINCHHSKNKQIVF
jgi:hypothetical protein